MKKITREICFNSGEVVDVCMSDDYNITPIRKGLIFKRIVGFEVRLNFKYALRHGARMEYLDDVIQIPIGNHGDKLFVEETYSFEWQFKENVLRVTIMQKFNI